MRRDLRVPPPPIYREEVVPHVGVVLRQAADGRSGPGVVDRRLRSSGMSAGWPSVGTRRGACSRVCRCWSRSASSPGLVALGRLRTCRRMLMPFVAERVAAVVTAVVVPVLGSYPARLRGPVEQMLAVVVPGFVGNGRPHRLQSRSRTRCRGSSSTWWPSVVCGRHRSATTSTTCVTSRSYLARIGAGARRGLAGGPERVHRRARCRGPGQDDAARWLRGAARVLALRAPRRRAGEAI